MVVMFGWRSLCVWRERETERETERDRERQRETKRERDRERETERDRERQRETERYRERQRLKPVQQIASIQQAKLIHNYSFESTQYSTTHTFQGANKGR
jgi:hypothetical protein